MKKYILVIAAFFTAGISGCKKDFLSLETNPNVPSVTTPALTLAAALNASAAIVSTDYSHYGVWGGFWTTSGNYVPNQTINQYQITNTSLNGDWGDWYSNLTNYNILNGLAAKDGSLKNYAAIATIMKAYGFSHLVDDFNNVPYSQAFQAGTTLYPVYDKGSDIYTDLFKQLDGAIKSIQAGGGATVGSDDIVFGGDMSKWIMFANTLKLRMAIRVSGVAGFDAKAILATTVTAADDPTTETNFFGASVQAVANPGFQQVAGKQNPFWNNYGFDATGNPTFPQAYYRANAFSISLLGTLNDPRATQLYSPTTGNWQGPAVIHGNVFGDTSPANLANPKTSSIGPGLLQSATQGQPLFSGPESLFLQAEAVNKGYLTGDDQGLYEAGITASFVAVKAGGTYAPVAADGSGNPVASNNLATPNYNYTAASKATSIALAQTYYGQAINNVGWAASTNKLEAIAIQKWIALNGYFNFEAWNEYRRTGFPVLPSSIDPAAISQTLPTRVLYPLSELTTNTANLAKEGTISVFTSKIFWAK